MKITRILHLLAIAIPALSFQLSDGVVSGAAKKYASATPVAVATLPAIFNINDYGARGDGKADNAKAIQQAIASALVPFWTSEGGYRLRNRVRYVIAAV